MEKSEAKSLGLKRYNTGSPCKRGHYSDRWTSTSMCCECLNQRNKEEYWKNPILAREKAKKKYKPEYHSAYYKANKEKIDERNKQWLADNSDKKSEIDAEYRKREVEKVAAANSKWSRENPEKRMAIWRNRQARIAGCDGTHTADDVSKIYASQSGLCVYCDADLSLGYHVDHIMPIALGGSNWPSNLQCLCPTCNIRKGAKHPDLWHDEIGYT
jgi:5-methylcytosine-specific restriction endonuclease McrA